ncbi:Blue light- and temperature-regulated antirepressor YcgF [Lignipirellula cremea]|uniref:Blue light-and temperature-regulated antirepressor YcgF n=2 Tax=Lignipirellula cremea TaxID=2528010 RepID=A0A518DZZ2_9BACT|nr:Blue light- and temperature-regulated antirepressor YcgF [Lignipirellula cremea]
MYQLVYLSLASHDFPASELKDLLAIARKNNVDLGITGMLIYRDRVFMQVLEGDELAVEKLYQKIKADPRHENCKVLLATRVPQRSFDLWSMGFYHAGENRLTELPGFIDFFGEHFPTDLSQVSGDLARRLLLAFRRERWKGAVETESTVSPHA